MVADVSWCDMVSVTIRLSIICDQVCKFDQVIEGLVFFLCVSIFFFIFTNDVPLLGDDDLVNRQFL